MQEKVLNNKKNGMAFLFLFLLLYLAAIGGVIFSAFGLSEVVVSPWTVVLFVISLVWLTLGWIPFCGLKVLKPQEALVLTLFGKYIGTLKNDGFYFVNPFCSSFNPAATTKLSQRAISSS